MKDAQEQADSLATDILSQVRDPLTLLGAKLGFPQTDIKVEANHLTGACRITVRGFVPTSGSFKKM